MTTKDHVEDAVLAAYDRYAPSVSEVTADRCALAFREGFLAGHAEAETEIRTEIERLQELDAIVREHIDHRELAFHLREWLGRDKCQ